MTLRLRPLLLRRISEPGPLAPPDFFIPLKSATYTVSSAPKPIPLSSKSPPAPSEDRDKDGGSTAQEGHVFTRRCSAIFPRELLHPNSYTIDDLRGHKDGRGYIICRKSAVSDFGKKGELGGMERGNKEKKSTSPRCPGRLCSLTKPASVRSFVCCDMTFPPPIPRPPFFFCLQASSASTMQQK